MTLAGNAFKSTLSILSWAIFLGVSWTWCIGMYLPVLMIRDYGVWAWVVFAIPNVIGAAAMAWVLPNAEASRQITTKHAVACWWFSLVTLLFHVFFFQRMYFAYGDFVAIEVAAWFLAIAMLLGHCADIPSAILAMAVSVVCAAKLWSAGQIPRLPPPVAPGFDLFYLALTCTFGLALCPYLDLTFHRARQATSPSSGKAAFAIGFGIVFFSMILFTLGYSGWFSQDHLSVWYYRGVLSLLFLHVAVQSLLKISLHGQVVIRHPTVLKIATTVIALLLVGIVLAPTHLLFDDPIFPELPFEFTYRLFMSFYALVFPAYVWICIFGKNRPVIFATAVAIAAPMYWMAFINRHMIWLLPGILIVVLARFVRPTMQARTLA